MNVWLVFTKECHRFISINLQVVSLFPFELGYAASQSSSPKSPGGGSTAWTPVVTSIDKINPESMFLKIAIVSVVVCFRSRLFFVNLPNVCHYRSYFTE